MGRDVLEVIEYEVVLGERTLSWTTKNGQPGPLNVGPLNTTADPGSPGAKEAKTPTAEQLNEAGRIFRLAATDAGHKVTR